MSTNLTLVTPQNQPSISREIAEALKTLRRADFRLEAEFYHMDWDAREELAAELFAACDDLSDEQADVIARVASDLQDESEDFSTWDARTDAAERVRRVIRSVQSEQKEVAF
jgi:hypothetical protein